MKKTIFILLSGIVVISLFTWCSNVSTWSNKWPEVVKIGVIAPLSGPAANYWEDAINTYKTVVNKFNLENKKITIELVIEDDKASPKDAASATQKLMTVDWVKAIVWPLFSAPAVSAWVLAEKNNVILLTPTASAASISDLGTSIYRFWNDEFATKEVGKYLNKQNIKKIVYVWENTDSGVDYYKWLVKYFSWEVTKFIYSPDEKDFVALAKQVKSSLSDDDYIVFFPASDVTAVSFIKSMEKEWILKTFKNKIFTNEIIINDSAIKQLWDLVEWFKTATFALTLDTPENADKFIEQFKNNYEIKWAPYLLLLEAEWLSLIIDTIKETGTNPETIKKSLNSINKQNPREWLFGNYYFDKNWDAIWLDFVLQQIENWSLITLQ